MNSLAAAGDIVQINKIGHTRAPAFQRIVMPALFDRPVQPGGQSATGSTASPKSKPSSSAVSDLSPPSRISWLRQPSRHVAEGYRQRSEKAESAD